MNQTRLVMIDSGEGSCRRKVVESFVRYLIGVRGIPAIALSNDAQMSKAYLALIPPGLKSKVYNLGSYHLYLQIAQKIGEIHELLFLDSSYISMLSALYKELYHEVQGRLVQDLLD